MSSLLTDEELKRLLLDINTELVMYDEWNWCNAENITHGNYEDALECLPPLVR